MINSKGLHPTPREQIYLAGLINDIGKFYPEFAVRWQQLALPSYPTETQNILAKARLWATQMDQQTTDKGAVTQPLRNLFSDISIKTKTGTATQFGFHPLTLNKSVLLRETVGNLETLRANFAEQLNNLPTGTWTAFATSLYHLLRQYTWCIPASTGAIFQSVSLFHHVKLTAAFAQCLYDFEQRAKTDTQSQLPLQLLCVDLSGIQSFIYNIGSRYAAKSLKGRSFSLQLLLDNIARVLIDVTDTTPSHLLYSSGGKFFMLLPNTEAINGKIEVTKKEIQAAIWDEYKGSLFVCFGRVAFNYQPKAIDSQAVELSNGQRESLSGLWQAVTRKAAEEKLQKHSAILTNSTRFDELFKPTGEGGDVDQCAVTGLEGKLEQLRGGLKVHASVSQQVKIGKSLTDARYLTLGDANAPYNLLAGTLPDFDLGNRPPLTDGSEYSQIMQPGEATSFLQSTSLGTLARSFRFYGGSQQATSIHHTNQPKNFEELTGIVRQDSEDDDSPVWRERTEGKYHRLAVLRMDVDSLGDLFTSGLSGARATFSAYATLSGLLDWFFSGYLNTIRQQDEFREWVNIIYSGGDDVFAVGRWDKLIAFADQIQRDFKAFTGRPELTISGGLVLIRPRYPIGKAATQAGEAEDIAKEHTHHEQPKNALCLFGLAVNWDTEWPFVVEYHRKLVDWLRQGQLSRGILQKLFTYYDIHARNEATRQAARKHKLPEPNPDLSWKWNAAYTLSRHRTDKNKEAVDDLKTLIFTKINDGNIRFEAFAIAMRWAELTIRDYPKIETQHGQAT